MIVDVPALEHEADLRTADYPIQNWLRRRIRADAAGGILLGLIGLCTGLVILFLVFLIGYFLGYFIVDTLSDVFPQNPIPFQFVIKTSVGAVFLALLFSSYLRNLRFLEEFEKPTAEFNPNEKRSFLFWHENRDPVMDDRRGTELQTLIFSGPAAFRFGLILIRKAWRQINLDVVRCAQILEIAARRGHRVSFSELETIIPDANRFHVFEQLRDIDGIVFLIREPAGISLIEDLRRALRPLLSNETKSRPQFTPPPPVMPEPPSELDQCFQLLGLQSSAPLDEIKKAYRKKIKECHPDRFTRFGKDWQKLAEEKSKQLNHAYEKIMEAMQ